MKQFWSQKAQFKIEYLSVKLCSVNVYEDDQIS
jgi:hypothetical protein